MFLRSEKNLRNLPKLLLNMPANKNALLRYKTIDKCLRNRARRWTLEDLVEACSDALYEYSGKDEYLSVRTIQLDIQRMRSDELGYNAPIVVRDRKYYTYEDPEYSISNVPLTDSDLGQMREAVAVLKQLSGFGGFSGVDDIVGRLEDYVNAVREACTMPLTLSLAISSSRLRVRTASVRDIALPAPWLQERNESGFPRPSVM